MTDTSTQATFSIAQNMVLIQGEEVKIGDQTYVKVGRNLLSTCASGW